MRLETERLILRDWEDKDIDDLVDGLNNYEVSKWLAFVPYPYTKENAKSWISFCSENIKKGDNRNSYDFAIELKSEGKVIGGVSLDKINKFQGTAGGGIWLNSKYQGFGYGTEAFGKRIEFAFEVLGLRRIDNGFFDGNEISSKMQKKFGYKVEGKRRAGFVCMADGKAKDEITTGLLREDWINNK